MENPALCPNNPNRVCTKDCPLFNLQKACHPNPITSAVVAELTKTSCRVQTEPTNPTNSSETD